MQFIAIACSFIARMNPITGSFTYVTIFVMFLTQRIMVRMQGSVLDLRVEWAKLSRCFLILSDFEGHPVSVSLARLYVYLFVNLATYS